MSILARVPALLFPLFALPAGAATAAGHVELERKLELTDAQIVGVLKTANDLEIKGGSLAADVAATDGVKAYGKKLVADHRASNARIAALGLATASSPIARSILLDAQSDDAHLKSLTGPDFDVAFLAHSIKMHGALLQLIDAQLAPSATSPAVTELLRKNRPVIQSHLEQAEKLQAELNAPEN